MVDYKQKVLEACGKPRKRATSIPIGHLLRRSQSTTLAAEPTKGLVHVDGEAIVRIAGCKNSGKASVSQARSPRDLFSHPGPFPHDRSLRPKARLRMRELPAWMGTMEKTEKWPWESTVADAAAFLYSHTRCIARMFYPKRILR